MIVLCDERTCEHNVKGKLCGREAILELKCGEFTRPHCTEYRRLRIIEEKKELTTTT